MVCHNYIAYFHDGIDVCTHGSPDPEEDHRATSIDFYNNDIHLMADDFIEADGGVHNIRIMRNRGVNAAQCGLSAQPVYGGPAYYIRNVLYHVPTGCGLKFNVEAGGDGALSQHDDYRSLPGDFFSNAHFRNNLFLGIDAPGRAVFRFRMRRPTRLTTTTATGRIRNEGAVPVERPEQGVSEGLRVGPLDARAIRLLGGAAHGDGTGGARAGGGLRRVRKSSRAGCGKPACGLLCAGDLNFRLKAGSKAVDAGVRLPNVNDDFTGERRTEGAYEFGPGRSGLRTAQAGTEVSLYRQREGEGIIIAIRGQAPNQEGVCVIRIILKRTGRSTKLSVW